MATYLNDVQGNIPDIGKFNPNYTFYAEALQSRQSAYDTNHEKLNNLYGSLLNGGMFRDENIKSRDEFFKAISDDIKKISGSDLSSPQNVIAAERVFNQILDNKYVKQDLYNYRKAQSTQKHIDNLRLYDKEGKYWEGMDQLLNYQILDYKEADRDSALNVNIGDIAEGVNVNDLIAKSLKDMNLGDVVQEISDGKYITKYTNGEIARSKYNMAIRAILMNDASVSSFYRAQGELARRNEIQALRSQGMTKEQATAQYRYNTTLSMLDENEEKYRTAYSTLKNALKDKSISPEQRLDGKKTLEAYNKEIAKIDAQQLRLRDEASMQPQEVQDNYNRLMQFLDTEKNTLKNESNSLNLKSGEDVISLSNIDVILGDAFLNKTISDYTNLYVQKDMKVEKRVDEYGLEDVRYRHALELEETKQENRIKLEEYKKRLEGNKNNPINPTITPSTGIPGLSNDESIDYDEGEIGRYRDHSLEFRYNDAVSNLSAAVDDRNDFLDKVMETETAKVQFKKEFGFDYKKEKKQEYQRRLLYDKILKNPKSWILEKDAAQFTELNKKLNIAESKRQGALNEVTEKIKTIPWNNLQGKAVGNNCYPLLGYLAEQLEVKNGKVVGFTNDKRKDDAAYVNTYRELLKLSGLKNTVEVTRSDPSKKVYKNGTLVPVSYKTKEFIGDDIIIASRNNKDEAKIGVYKNTQVVGTDDFETQMENWNNMDVYLGESGRAMTFSLLNGALGASGTATGWSNSRMITFNDNVNSESYSEYQPIKRKMDAYLNSETVYGENGSKLGEDDLKEMRKSFMSGALGASGTVSITSNNGDPEKISVKFTAGDTGKVYFFNMPKTVLNEAPRLTRMLESSTYFSGNEDITIRPTQMNGESVTIRGNKLIYAGREIPNFQLNFDQYDRVGLIEYCINNLAIDANRNIIIR